MKDSVTIRTLALSLCMVLSACSQSHQIPSEILDDEQQPSGSDSDGNRGEFLNVKIKHHMGECSGFQIDHCYLVQKDGQSEWNYFYDTIEGFEYEWGYEYHVLLWKTPAEIQRPNSPTHSYKLLEIHEAKSHANEHFDYTSRYPAATIEKLSERLYSLQGKALVHCSDSICSSIESVLAQEQAAILQFKHGATLNEPLELTQIHCADSYESFDESCLEVFEP